MTPAPRHREASVGLRSTFAPLLDDAGRPIRRISRADLLRAARSERPEMAMVARRLRAAIKSESRRNTPDRVLFIVILAVAVVLLHGAATAAIVPVFGFPGAGLSFLLLLAFALVGQRVYTAYVRRGALNQIARTAVAEGVCGSCAFSLEGAVESDEGVLTCPECGAAWRAERVVAPFWAEPVTPVLERRILPGFVPGVRHPRELYAPDDRGRYVQTPDARLMRLRRDLLDPVPPDERAELRRAMRRVGRWWRLLVMLLIFPLPAFTLWGAWTLYADKEPLGAWILGGFGLIFLIPTLLVPFGVGFCGPHRTARVIVRRGRCGSCLHPLADAPADAEGRLVCPRCAAAWLTDPARTTP